MPPATSSRRTAEFSLSCRGHCSSTVVTITTSRQVFGRPESGNTDSCTKGCNLFSSVSQKVHQYSSLSPSLVLPLSLSPFLSLCQCLFLLDINVFFVWLRINSPPSASQLLPATTSSTPPLHPFFTFCPSSQLHLHKLLSHLYSSKKTICTTFSPPQLDKKEKRDRAKNRAGRWLGALSSG